MDCSLIILLNSDDILYKYVKVAKRLNNSYRF